MKKYLSLGGGVNSTALMFLLMDEGEDFEAIFADPGSEHPETYNNIERLKELHPITVLPGLSEGQYLYDFCITKQIIPFRMARWCSDKFKTKIIQSYMDKPCVCMIGIDAGEAQRVRYANKRDIENEYPLVDRGINREMCERIIEQHGFLVPRKSGCYFCPFQRLQEIKALRIDYPELFCKVRTMEQRCNERQKANGKSPVYLLGKPVDTVAQSDQLDFWREHQPCMCEL